MRYNKLKILKKLKKSKMLRKLKKLRIFTSVLPLLALCVALSGCGKGAYGDGYRDGISCREISEQITAQLPAELDFRELDESFREFYFDESDGFDDCYIVYSAENEDISEIGIFHAECDEDAEAVERACREYIADLGENSRAFISSYAPWEVSKLDGAEVRRYGRYVAYTVLRSEDSEKVFDMIRKALEK